MSDEELSTCPWQVHETEELLVYGLPTFQEWRAYTKRLAHPWGCIFVILSPGYDDISSEVMCMVAQCVSVRAKATSPLSMHLEFCLRLFSLYALQWLIVFVYADFVLSEPRYFITINGLEGMSQTDL